MLVMKQIILNDPEALLGKDLSKAFKAVRAEKLPSGMVARFKKKEDIGRMTKSILKHKIQTLTGKSIKSLEKEMGYEAKNPDEYGRGHHEEPGLQPGAARL